MSQIQAGRYLSANSHEIKRKLDGVYDKFNAANYGKYSELLKKTIDEFLNNPIVTNHKEKDVQWSVILLLLELGYNPVASLKNRLMSNSDIFKEYVEEPVNLDETFEERIVKELRQEDLDGVNFTAEESDLSVSFNDDYF